MLQEIRDSFMWGKVNLDRGLDNLDDEQIEWLIKQAEKVALLESSLKVYKEESDMYERSTHIEDCMYEINVNEKGEIPCLIKANGVEHSFGITKKDALSFVHLFRMHEMD